jgi:integrase
MGRKTYKKSITLPEVMDKIEPKNIELSKRFLKEKDTRSSDLTIENYKSDLNIFFCWNVLENGNKLFTEIRKIEFSDFFAYAVSEMQWGSARFARAKSTLSSFSNFIEKFYDDVYPTFRNVILQSIENMPRIARRDKTILTEAQVMGIFDHFAVRDETSQMLCWLALAISSGSRFSELLRFTTDMIDFSNTAFQNVFIETMYPVKTKGRTKSGKMIHKYIIADIFKPHYEKWIVERQQILDKNSLSHNLLFVKKDGSPAIESTARGWAKEIEKFLGIPFYPHCLRHYTTSYLARVGLPYNLIKEIFGWESIEMVSIYDDTVAKDKKWAELDGLANDLAGK